MNRNDNLKPSDAPRLWLLRVVIVGAVILGINYVSWRWLYSVNWQNWWIGVPLVLAETYSVVDLFLFGFTMWRSRRRGAAPPPLDDVTVDVFIATYNEPIDLVMKTARAAQKITYPHKTWILDDGARSELRMEAENLGVGYITRGKEWNGKPRHAKAGNLNNALMQTDGEFILVLDADMIPRPGILDSTLGYFRDEKVALVQTPQIFMNVPQGDPLGSQAPLFYGPIQEGKDGWNAAFFCGSNAVLRREPLMQLGILGYVSATEDAVLTALGRAASILQRERRRPSSPEVAVVLAETAGAIRTARRQLARGESYGEVTYTLHQRVATAARLVVANDMAKMTEDLASLGLSADDLAVFSGGRDDAVTRLSSGELSPLNALESVQSTLRDIDVNRPGEAQVILPLATNSVTEDMSTSMRLHALGWESVFHNELLADGLAPEDLGTMLTQRLRWAQGTMQVFLAENPLFRKGLTVSQRLMYFSTMWSYISGFTSVIYLAAPVIFLTAGILPVQSFAAEFFWHFLPFLAANQLLFLVASHGLPTWRGQQYTLALFPLWIQACVSAAANVTFGRALGFAVTPKDGKIAHGLQLRRIRIQIITVVVLLIAIVIGIFRLVILGDEPVGTIVNVVWVIYDFLAFSVLIGAVRYRGYQEHKERK
ncbi:cellulose synthase (UDP-forming) [Microbacterium endophyticum]|uniref:Cellulose synthase (UDP-forming) n=1 Tax=Microbacterium endophyticum TaxID=1526412 RepID=A0A7W4YM76_9MICO|nr:glycosyltransferase family 2 protein [Microbacterium endophyticum]MBB2976180.1 cellulose synthase (UDP-forming) [Microbacterium endophyticum]NIK36477.1 cellulose synthase (UDP-forming) [Microbacterium endophyticum]